MPTPTDNSGPAFPVVHAIIPRPGSYTQTPEAQPGMTLRDYFAAKALAVVSIPEEDGSRFTSYEAMTDEAYRLADAMLKSRAK